MTNKASAQKLQQKLLIYVFGRSLVILHCGAWIIHRLHEHVLRRPAEMRFNMFWNGHTSMAFMLLWYEDVADMVRNTTTFEGLLWKSWILCQLYFLWTSLWQTRSLWKSKTRLSVLHSVMKCTISSLAITGVKAFKWPPQQDFVKLQPCFAFIVRFQGSNEDLFRTAL